MTSIHDAVEAFRRFVLDHELPKTNLSLFGLRCPYCGKSDRIKPLENPETLSGELPAESLNEYSRWWKEFTLEGNDLAFCEFCRQPLRLLRGSDRAAPLNEEDTEGEDL
jgi:hypothetical protein